MPSPNPTLLASLSRLVCLPSDTLSQMDRLNWYRSKIGDREQSLRRKRVDAGESSQHTAWALPRKVENEG
jgi:hypothetical protein